jgi:signal transduction histidine kinase
MHPFASGAAFVDRAGAVVAADAAFVERLGLRAGDPTAGLRERAAAVPELRALLSGEGPARVRVAGADGTALDVERVASDAGALLVVREVRAQEWLEHAMRSEGLTRLAAGLAHDIKNPLNAMSLQIALLVEKLSGADAGAASSGHLGALREQIGRVNEVVRRFLDVADPSAPLGYTDLGLLLGDAASLFVHDARRRRIEVVLDGQAGVVKTRCDPARVGRLLVGLLARALAETPDGGRLAGHAEIRDADALVAIEHTAGDPDPDLGYYTGVAMAAADALGGRFSLERLDAIERLMLTLPRNDHE